MHAQEARPGAGSPSTDEPSGRRGPHLQGPSPYAVPSDAPCWLNSLPSGFYTLLIEHPTYALFGFDSAERDPTIEDQGLSQRYVRALVPVRHAVTPQRGSGVALNDRR
jgi:hypothetical protein